MLKPLHAKLILSALAPYSVMVAAIYLAGYWGSIRINPFEYASASDLLSASLAGLTVVLLIMAAATLAGVLTGKMLASAHDAAVERIAAKVEGSDGVKPRIPTRDHVSRWIFYLSLLLVPLALIFLRGGVQYTVLGGVLTIAVSFAFNSSDFLETTIPNRELRFLLIFLGVFLPFVTYGKGVDECEKARGPLTGILVDRARSGLGDLLRQPTYYLGVLGTTYFLYEDKTKSVVLIPENRLMVLTPGQSNTAE